jgi:hypothetical protein
MCIFLCALSKTEVAISWNNSQPFDIMFETGIHAFEKGGERQWRRRFPVGAAVKIRCCLARSSLGCT